MTVLVLAGTGEAKRLIRSLADSGVELVASLAGATRDPEPLPAPTRTGGYGSADGFRAYLAEAGISAVVDATHPFAHRITARTAAICADLGVPYLLLRRPGWQQGPGDDWTFVDREEEAAALIPSTATVFLATGRQTLDRFANLAPRRVICRQIDPPTAPFPFEGGEFLIGRPPFSQARERALFTALGIDWLVVKNAGGDASRTKLDAARALGLPVILLRRPDAPTGVATVETVAAARDWVLAL